MKVIEASINFIISRKSLAFAHWLLVRAIEASMAAFILASNIKWR